MSRTFFKSIYLDSNYVYTSIFHPSIHANLVNFCVHRNANKQEIIKAYRKLAQQWHPDNFQSETEKKEAEKKFIDIASAKEVLTDPGQEQRCVRHNRPSV